jgi:2-methylisocitrate lyase-like PEP mutase family enzyme
MQDKIPSMTNQLAAIARFRALHESGCFVLPNPWDAGTALYLQHLGFEAVATTSAGFAFSRALPDSVSAVPVDLVLAHVREIVAATSLPVNADFQNCYADDPEGVANNVARCIATGVAGLSVEDATGENANPLYEFALAVDRVKAARAAIAASGVPVVLTARCEAWLVGDANPLQTSLDRLIAFAAAGADCLYAPGVTKPDEIAAIVKAVAPKPVNVLVSTNNSDITVSQLADLGVRRISVGAALARVAWGAFIQSARVIKERGSFKAFADAAPFNELNSLFVAQPS